MKPCPDMIKEGPEHAELSRSAIIGSETWEPEKFDGLRKQLIPSFSLLYESAADAVRMTLNKNNPKILDLGAGTGLLSATVLIKIPDAELYLLDMSEAMLRKALQRFNGGNHVHTIVGDLEMPLPPMKFDAVVSGLAIHHLTHDGKQQLFSRILESLSPNGIFVNVEQVLAPYPEVETMYDARHEQHVFDSNTPADEWAAGRERMKLDICADTESQLLWLREAGFSKVDCLAKDWRFSTYAAWA